MNSEGNQVKQALRDSQARLAGIIDSAMDAIITVDNEQRILVFNLAAEKMFRCPALEAIGESLEHFIPDRFRAIHSSHIQSFGQTGVSTRAMAGARAVYGL
ncbi:MAG: histidine kinase, partial [Acidobacteria bacterium]